jgi:putative endonuclease
MEIPMFSFFQRWLASDRDKDTGKRGEELAAAWLRRERGFKIVTRNWRSPRDRRDEIDLVCCDGETLVFVEVKARAGGALVPGYFAVDARKKRALKRAAEVYLARLRVRPRTFRFDVVEVTFPFIRTDTAPAGKIAILHFENVPLVSKHF